MSRTKLLMEARRESGKKKKKKKKKKKGRKRQTREKMREEILISKIFTLVKLDAATMTHDDLFGIDYH